MGWMILTYVAYFALLVVFFAPFALNMFNGTVAGAICGVLIFLIMTTVLIIVTVKTIKGTKQDNLPLEDPKLSSTDMLLRYRDRLNVLAAKRGNNVGPFSEVWSPIIESINSVGINSQNITKLIDEAFSPTDLTYTQYHDTLDATLKQVLQNCKGIYKRVDMFNYRGWQLNKNNPDYMSYVEEVKKLTKRNQDIANTLEHLVHELIRLDDISEEPLKELKDLIDMTKQYQTL